MDGKLKIFSDLSHPKLAQEICQYLGVKLGDSKITVFGNGNPVVEIFESVRGADVFVVGTQAPPASENFFAFCVLINALKYASAGRVTAVMPYMFESRSDKKDRPRISIVARLVAKFIEKAGADKVLAIDLHSPQIQGFFRLPMNVLDAAPLLCSHLKKRSFDDYVLVACDSGESKKLDPLRAFLPENLPLAVFDKRRKTLGGKPEFVDFIGDVAGKTALLIDDEISTGHTIAEALTFLRKHLPPEKQPKEVRVMATHPILCGNAIQTLNEAGIKELLTVETVPVPLEKIAEAKFELTVLSPAELLARAIKIIHEEGSISQLWK